MWNHLMVQDLANERVRHHRKTAEAARLARVARGRSARRGLLRTRGTRTGIVRGLRNPVGCHAPVESG